MPAGVIISVSVMIAYGLARAETCRPTRPGRPPPSPTRIASLWVLVIQARPLNSWKMILVATMAGLAALAFIVPFGRSFFDLTLPPTTTLLQSIALGAAAAFALEMTSRLAGRIRRHRISEAVEGRSVVGRRGGPVAFVGVRRLVLWDIDGTLIQAGPTGADRSSTGPWSGRSGRRRPGGSP